MRSGKHGWIALRKHRPRTAGCVLALVIGVLLLGGLAAAVNQLGKGLSKPVVPKNSEVR